MAGQELRRKPAVLKKSSGSRHSRLSASSLRSRREAAHRSRDTVRGYVRLLQKNPEPELNAQKPVDGSPITGTHEVQPEQIRERLNEIVTITIRDPSPNERRSSRPAKRPNYAVLNSGSQSPNEVADADKEELSSSTYTDAASTSKKHHFAPKKELGRQGKTTSNDPFVCQRCRETFPTVDVFCRHFELKHCKPILENPSGSQSHSFACDRCPFITQDEYDFEKHSVMHLRMKDLVNSKVNGRYRCHRCSFSARSAITICHHLKKHTQEKISQTFFACTDCTARFVTRNEVFKHQSLIHGKKDVYHRSGPS